MNPQSMMTTTATVRRATYTSDAIGGRVPTWTNTMIAIPYELQPMNAEERNQYNRETENVTHRGYTTVAGIRHGDQIVCQGKTLLVKGSTNTASRGLLYVHTLLEIN